MKQAILALLSRLVNSMKSESRRFHSLVLPIIKGAVEPNSVSLLTHHSAATDITFAVLTME